MSSAQRIPEPVVFPPYPLRRGLAYPVALVTWIPKLLVSSQHAIPRPLKFVLGLLLLWNWTQIPFYWHIRMAIAAYYYRAKSLPYRHILLPFRDYNAALTIPGVEPRLRLEALPLGKNPFEDATVFHFRAWPSECDWNMHLSNSSYNRALDYVRMAHMMRVLPRVLSDGGFLALGGSTYSYHREIPIGVRFDIELSTHAWDEKWIYLIARFIEPPRRPGTLARSKSAQNLKKLAQDVVAGPRAPLTTSLHENEQSHELRGAASVKPRKVYCTSISRYVVKAPSRRTVPPWIVMATGGYGVYASSRVNFERAENIRKDLLNLAVARNGGKPLPRDSSILGGGHRKAGLLSVFHEAAERGDAWTRPGFWELAEFDATNKAHLETLNGRAGRFDL